MNPVNVIVRALVVVFEATIMAAWNAARDRAHARIMASLATDEKIAEINQAIADLQQEAIEAPKRGKGGAK